MQLLPGAVHRNYVHSESRNRNAAHLQGRSEMADHFPGAFADFIPDIFTIPGKPAGFSAGFGDRSVPSRGRSDEFPVKAEQGCLDAGRAEIDSHKRLFAIKIHVRFLLYE
jgi:hypothetical protein